MWTSCVASYVLGLATIPIVISGIDLTEQTKVWWKNRKTRKEFETTWNIATEPEDLEIDDGTDEINDE